MINMHLPPQTRFETATRQRRLDSGLRQNDIHVAHEDVHHAQ